MNSKDKNRFISKQNKKHILLIVNALLMVVLITVATYAWFSRNTIDEVKVDEIAFEGSSDLEVSLTGNDNDYAFSKQMSFPSSSLSQEITGDGLPANFYHARTQASPENSTILVPMGNSSTWQKADEGGQYKKQKVYFRSKEALTVYLGSGSTALGEAEINGMKLVGNSDEVGNKSTTSGIKNSVGTSVSVSKDCIVGASRVGFLNADESAVSFVWIPRANIFYDTITEGKTIYGGTSSNLDNINTEHPNNPLCPNATTHYYYNASGSKVTATKVVPGDNGLSTGVENEKSKVVKLTKSNASDEYYKGETTVVIWIEGCDAEARRAFAGGKFGVNMQFVGFPS